MDAPYSLRPAQENDTAAINRLIKEGRINPTGLDWRRFLLAVTATGEVIGCGQIKPHRDGSSELASIAVAEIWRGKGVAGEIIRQLIAGHEGPLYLMCRSGLGELYQKFGFRLLEPDEMPRYFKHISVVGRIISALQSQGETLLVMGRDI